MPKSKHSPTQKERSLKRSLRIAQAKLSWAKHLEKLLRGKNQEVVE